VTGPGYYGRRIRFGLCVCVALVCVVWAVWVDQMVYGVLMVGVVWAVWVDRMVYGVMMVGVLWAVWVDRAV